MEVTITSLGNAGVLFDCPSARILFDPFSWELPVLKSQEGADLILVTHSHWDHFDRRRVGELAIRTGACVCGPRSVIQSLRGSLRESKLVEMEPSALRRNLPADSVAVKVGPAAVRAYRTYHSPDHNSYLVELPGLRLLHDGDNENTRLFDLEILKPLDILGLCPWRGSDWAAFIERLKPRHWLLIHLNPEELEDHARGRFLPELCDRIPMQPLALHPGESVRLSVP